MIDHVVLAGKLALVAILINAKIQVFAAGGPQCVLPSCANGQVMVIHGECECLCDEGFMGPNCDMSDSCAQGNNPCHHGGRCYKRHDDQVYCDCPLGYLAPDCRDRDPCATMADHCFNGATCQRLDDIDFSCACALPFEGDHCERKNLCRLDVGECIDSRNSAGELLTECHPCSENTLPGGCRINDSGNYSCDCLPGYTGEACDDKKIPSVFTTTLTLPVDRLNRMHPHNFIIHNVQLPRNRDIIIGINVSSVYLIHVGLSKGLRPTCSEVVEQWDEILPTTSGTYYRMLNLIKGTRSSHINDGAEETDNYYVALWPESSAWGTDRRVEVTLGLGFYEFDCVHSSDPKTQNNSPAPAICFTTEKTSGRKLVDCTCLEAPLETMDEFLKPLEFRTEIYVPVPLLEHVRPFYIIPWIVLAFLILYTLLLLIACVLDRRSAMAVRFVVLTDIELIEKEHFYLLTVETGNHPCAGTSANVSCEIYGSASRSKALVLADRTIGLLQRHGEVSNFLFSAPKDLGEVERIRIWHDNSGSSPAWLVTKLVVKNIKTNRCWHCNLNQWMCLRDSTLILYADAIPAAGICTPETFCNILSRQFRERHLFLSPVLCSPAPRCNSSARLTILFTTIFLHMFLLICWYGFPDRIDAIYGIEWGESWIFSGHVLLYAFTVSLVALLMSALLSYLFSCVTIAKIPTLLVCETLKKLPPKRPPPPQDVEVVRWQNLDPEREMVVADVKQEMGILSTDTDSAQNFRIPSTSVSRTETWIASHVTHRRRSIDPVERIPESPKLEPYKKILNDGVIGAVTSLKDEDMDRLIYKPESDDTIDEMIAKDIRDSFRKPLWPMEDHLSTKTMAPLGSAQQAETREVETVTSFIDDQIIASPSASVTRVSTNESEAKENINVKLCEVPASKQKCHFGKCQRIIFWLVCICLIICCSTVTIIYGMRYGIKITLDWIYSFIWTFLFSFLLSLLFQVLLYSVFAYCFAKRHQADLETECHKRFQILRVTDCCEKRGRLNYITYFPKQVCQPLTAFTMFRLKADADRNARLLKNLMDIFMWLLFVLCLIILFASFRLSHFYHYKRSEEIISILNHHFDHNSPRSTQAGGAPFSSVLGALLYFKAAVEKGAGFWKDDNVKQENIHEYYLPRSENLAWLRNNMSVLLGTVQLRQQRINKYEHQTTNGTEPARLKANSDGLFKHTLLKSTRDTGTYWEGWSDVMRKTKVQDNKSNVVWEWMSESQTGSLPNLGIFGRYDGGGFVTTINKDQPVSATLDNLEDAGWLDDRTRVLFLEYTTYNPFIRLFNVHQLVAERSPFRSWEMSEYTWTHMFILNYDDISWMQLLLICILLVCLGYFLYRVIVNFTSHWNLVRIRRLSYLWLDFSVVAWGAFVWIVFVIAVKATMSRFSSIQDYEDSVHLQRLVYLYSFLLYSSACLLLLGFCKLWSLFAPRCGRCCIVWLTLSITGKQILGLALFYLVLIIAFAAFSHLAFGPFGRHYSSFWQAILSLLQVHKTGASVSFRTLVLYNRVLGPMFYLLYHVLMYFLWIFLIVSILILGVKEARYSLASSEDKRSAIVEICINRKRLLRMKAILKDTLLQSINSPWSKRLHGMKTVAVKVVNPAKQQIVSKRTKLAERRKAQPGIPENKFQRMRSMTAKFIKTKTAHEFQPEAHREYKKYNEDIAALKYIKLQLTIIKLEVAVRKAGRQKDRIKSN